MLTPLPTSPHFCQSFPLCQPIFIYLYQYFASWVGKMQGIVYFLLLLLLLWGTDGQTCPGGWYLVYDGGYVCRTQRNSNYIHVGQV
jgi:hypothetical protein